MLWNWIQVSESLLNEVDIFLVVLDTTCDNQALSWSDVVHDELLKESSIDVVDVFGHTKSWHTEGIVSISSSQQKLLVGGEWIVF